MSFYRVSVGILNSAKEDDGTVHTIPFHRVRKVWRNDKLI
ncbi:MAG: DUF504 domain-containing protein [Nitrosomonas sp.]|nr:DUF504 domain-containing protein [Nitrosomonas sp.]